MSREACADFWRWCAAVPLIGFTFAVAGLGGCGTIARPQAGTTSSSDTLFSTVAGEDYGYEIVAAKSDDPAGEWTFALKPQRPPKDSNLRFEWEIDGQAYQGLTVSHIFTQAGAYVISVRAMEPNGNEVFVLTLDIQIELPPPPNQAPVAVAQAVSKDGRIVERDGAEGEQVWGVYENEQLFLDGSESYDPDGDDISFAWAQVTGDASHLVQLVDASAAVASFVAPTVDGDVRVAFTLTVSDGLRGTDVTVPVDVLDIVEIVDNCPNDPDKTEPGQCGCGNPDTDSDNDGTADCNDACSNDPNNDVDGDGVCGDVDNCPEVANADQSDGDFDGVGDACESGPTGCNTSSSDWQNLAIGSQRGVFIAAFDVTPRGESVDGLVTLSSGPGSTFADYAVLIRFNVDGRIDARNGGAYGADVLLGYSSGSLYHMRVVVNVPSHTYSVYVTPPDPSEPEVALATDYAFRTEQNAVAELNNRGLWASNGSHDVCNFTISTEGPLVAEAGADLTVTIGSSVTLAGFAYGGTSPYTYTWTPSTGLSDPNVSQPTALPLTTTRYTLSVVDSDGTTASDSVTVTVEAAQLSVDAGPDKTIARGNITTLAGSASGGEPPYQYRWLPTTDLDDPTAAQPAASPSTTTTYTLTVTDATGTSASDTVTVMVQDPSGGLTPIARWDVVPYQRIDQADTLNCGVVAFSKHGIERVVFTIAGQGYDGPSPIEVREMTYNDQTDVYEYWIPISADSFASDGPITVEATVHGVDGGIRDKNTGGGGLGLDPLSLLVNPTGGLPRPEAWVDLDGDDSTGRVNSPTQPFLTIGKAVDKIREWMNANGHGNKADGGLVHLNTGTHLMSAGGIWSEIPTVGEWVTITTAAGGTKGNTRIATGGSAPHTKLTKVEGITLQSTREFGYIFKSPRPEMLWVHDCDIIGGGRWVVRSNPVDPGLKHKWFTNVYIYDTAFAVGGGRLARNVRIEHIGDDIFQNHPLGINIDATGIDPGSTYWHADVWQRHGCSAPRNTILYNVRAADVHYQGLMLRWTTSVSPVRTCSGVPPPADMAFVNVYIEFGDPIRPGSAGGGGGGSNLWMIPAEHVLLWHCAFVSPSADSGAFAIYDDNPVGQDTVITEFDVRGTVFSRAKISAASVDTSSWDANHYVHTSVPPEPDGKYFTVTPGSNITTGDPMLDTFGRPLSMSPLLNRVGPLLAPTDADGKPRDSLGDVGAYER
ncbi:MAG: hypothetical protein JSU86_00115 [Phycisphaerales bacterium]|nr:MAG: hypothetical protein JSU86_00115 [Phycisphaerales bacterium]